MKKFLVLIALVPLLMVGSAYAYEAQYTGFYQNNGGNMHYYTAGSNVPNAYTYIGDFNNGGGSAKQKQKQGQIQMQGQTQSQKTDVSIGNGFGNFSPKSESEAFAGAIGQAGDNNLSVDINNPVNRRELPNIPGYATPAPGEYRGPWDKTIYQVVRPWTMQRTWFAEDIDKLPKGGDVLSSCVFDLERSKSFTLVSPRQVKEGEIAWFVMADSSNPIELWGTAGNQALKDGATECAVIGYVPYGQTKGSGFNIGIGGGISAVNGGSNDNYGGSVGPGMGYGNFSVGPVEKAKMALQCFHIKK